MHLYLDMSKVSIILRHLIKLWGYELAVVAQDKASLQSVKSTSSQITWHKTEYILASYAWSPEWIIVMIVCENSDAMQCCIKR